MIVANHSPTLIHLIMEFKKLATRTVSGVIYCAVIVLAILLGPYGVASLGMLLSFLGCIEFAQINHDNNKGSIPLILLDIAGCWCLVWTVIYPVLFIIWVFIILGRFIAQLYSSSENPLRQLSHSLMTQLYIGFPLAFMTVIAWIWNSFLILLIFVLIWINDTGAFLVGSSIGKHRLFERISPKKSWEGFFGGLILVFIAIILFYYFCPGAFGISKYIHSIWTALGFAATVTVFGTYGDLIESMIKRNLKIKDSGNLIPGHGGILDRIDSLLLAIPAIFIYLTLLMISE